MVFEEMYINIRLFLNSSYISQTRLIHFCSRSYPLLSAFSHNISPLSAIMTNICANINSTMSANIRCASPAHCIESMYKTGDCTGTATFAVDIVTDGKCNELKDPVTGKVVYGQFSQVDLKDAIKSMHKPYLGVWSNDATCGGGALAYQSGGKSFGTHNFLLVLNVIQCF